jgi:hypothetical protein
MLHAPSLKGSPIEYYKRKDHKNFYRTPIVHTGKEPGDLTTK